MINEIYRNGVKVRDEELPDIEINQSSPTPLEVLSDKINEKLNDSTINTIKKLRESIMEAVSEAQQVAN